MKEHITTRATTCFRHNKPPLDSNNEAILYVLTIATLKTGEKGLLPTTVTLLVPGGDYLFRFKV